MGKLTDVDLKNKLRAGKPDAKADGGGLTFTLSAKGTAAWTLRYRMAGKRKELTLGRYPDMSLAKAREIASAKRAEIRHPERGACDPGEKAGQEMPPIHPARSALNLPQLPGGAGR